MSPVGVWSLELVGVGRQVDMVRRALALRGVGFCSGACDSRLGGGVGVFGCLLSRLRSPPVADEDELAEGDRCGDG